MILGIVTPASPVGEIPTAGLHSVTIQKTVVLTPTIMKNLDFYFIELLKNTVCVCVCVCIYIYIYHLYHIRVLCDMKSELGILYEYSITYHALDFALDPNCLYEYIYMCQLSLNINHKLCLPCYKVRFFL